MDETELPDTGPGEDAAELAFGAPLTDAMRADPQLWLENFKERLCLAFEASFADMAENRSYLLENEWKCDLNILDHDQLKTLLFADGYAESSRAHDDEYGGLWDNDKRLLKDELKELLSGPFEEELVELAEALEVHDHTLQEDLIEDGDDLFRAYFSDNVDERSYYEIKYSGRATAYLSLGSGSLDATNPENMPELIDLLQRVRIDVDSFLAAVERSQDPEHASQKHRAAFSDFAAMGSEDEGRSEQEKFIAYREEFLRVAHTHRYSTLTSPEDTARLGPPVVTADELLHLLVQANGNDLYLHVNVDSDTIDAVGAPMSDERSETLALNGRCVRIGSGYISVDESAYRPGLVELRSFIDVDPEHFSISSERPDRKEATDSLEMLPHLVLNQALSDTICKDRACINPSSTPFDLSDDQDRQALKRVAQVLDGAPWWAAMLAAQKWSLLPPSVLEGVHRRRSPAAIEEASRELLRRIEGLPTRGLQRFFELDSEKNSYEHGLGSKRFSALQELVELGARCDLPNATGADAFQILCKKGAPDFILDMAAGAHADISRSFEKSALIDGTGARTLNATSLSLLDAGLYRSPERRDEHLGPTRWLLAQGIGPTAQRDLVDLAGMEAPDVMTAAFEVFFADRPNDVEDHQLLFRQMLDACATYRDKHTLAALIKLGADERLHRTRPYKELVLEANPYPSESRTEFLTMLQALAAKRTADEEVKNILAAASTRSPRTPRRVGA